MTPLRRPGQARPTAAATLVAVVVVLCQATAWVHAAATPHVTCLEHGESVHLPVATGAATQAHGDAQGRAGAGGASASAATESEAHAHEHCGLQGQRTTSATSPDDDASIARFAPATLTALVDAPPTRGLLRLAPKTSPPRSAAA